MTVEEFSERYPDVEISPDILPYARFLQQCGKRFLVHFGYENCIRMAQDEMERRLADRGGLPN